MENCPEANIHSYKDLRNGKMLGILKDKTLSIFDESTLCCMSIFCNSRSNLVNKLLCPLKFLNGKSIQDHI